MESEWTVQWLDEHGIDGKDQREMLCRWHNSVVATERKRNILIGNERDELLELRDRLCSQRIMLVDALKRIKTGLGDDRPVLTEIIDAALAKVKGES